MDELAHTNAPGSRNRKRWQDVEELIAAGINVIGAFNVQHLESLNDLVDRATGVRVRETIPDAWLKTADQVVNLDLAVEDLEERLQAGKIYASGEGAPGPGALLPARKPRHLARAGAPGGGRVAGAGHGPPRVDGGGRPGGLPGHG